MRRAGRNHSRAVFPNIHLAIHIANAAHHLWVRRIDVIGLAKRFLRNLPVTGMTLATWHCLYRPPRFQRSNWKQILNKVIKGRTVLIRIDENKPCPSGKGYFGQRERVLVNVREIPICWDILQLAISFQQKP